jgi:hypothetical protein
MVLVVPSLALAKPLPSGLKITLAQNEVIATRDGVTVAVSDSTSQIGKLVSAELSDDGATLQIKGTSCWGDDPDTISVPLVLVEARFENVVGMKLLTKKQYANAIVHFALAAQKDPESPVFATNLLSAQSLAGKLDDGDRTITRWIYWARRRRSAGVSPTNRSAPCTSS